MKSGMRTGATARGAAGFTLLEMLLVVAILALLAALVGSRLVGAFGGAQVKTTKSQIESLSSNIERMRLDIGRYPTAEEGLRVLIEKPQTNAEKWAGPYLPKEVLPKDGWGNEFVYQIDETWGFRIVSYGADAKPGGEGENADLDNRS